MILKLIYTLLIANLASHAAVITWTNFAGGSWNLASNWQPNQVPGAADSALITNSGDYTITLTNSVTVLGYTLGGAAGSQSITLTGQVLRATEGARIGDRGLITVESGGLDGILTNAGTIVFSGAAQKSLGALALFNQGLVNWQEGALSLVGTATLTNSGRWDITADGTISRTSGSAVPVLVNSGTIRKLSSGTTTFSALCFKNSGTVSAQAGILQFANMLDSEIGGIFTSSVGATIRLAGGTMFEAGGAFNGAGTNRLTGGTLTLLTNRIAGLDLTAGTIRLGPVFQNGGAISDLTLNGATLVGTNEVAGTLTVIAGGLSQGMRIRTGGTLVFSSATQKALTGVNLLNNGTVRWQGGNLALGSAVASFITNSGLWEIQGDFNVVVGTGGPLSRFVNLGTVRKISGTGTTAFSNLQFVNGGTLDVQSGVVQLTTSTDSTLGGTVSAAGGATFQLASGSYTVNGATFSGAGTLRMNGGVLTLAGDDVTGLALLAGEVRISETFQAGGAITNLTINGATLAGTNRVAGFLNILAGSVVDQLTVQSNGVLAFPGSVQKRIAQLTLINRGTVRWLGGNLLVGSNPTTIITNFGLWEIGADNTLASTNSISDPVIVNLGTVRKTSGPGAAVFSNIHFHNAGAIEVKSGLIQFVGAAGSALGGTVTTDAGAAFQLSSGTYFENRGVFSGEGLSRMTGGTLFLERDRLSGLSLAGGEVRLSTNFQAAGAITNLTISGALLGGDYQVAGTLDVTAGTITNRLSVRAGGTLRFLESSPKNLQQLTLLNFGTVRWAEGNLILSANPGTVITNFGLWEISGDNVISTGAGSPLARFMNLGQVRKLGGAGTTMFFGLHLDQRGTMEALSGTIQLSAVDAIFNGSMSAYPGASLALASGNFVDNGAQFGGGGSLPFNGGTLLLTRDRPSGLSLSGGEIRVGPQFQAAGAITNLTLEGSVLAGTNRISGTLTLASGGLRDSLTILPTGSLLLPGASQKNLGPGVLVNNGTIRWFDGNIALDSSTVITNRGIWEILGGDMLMVPSAAPGAQFVNTGILRKLSGAGASILTGFELSNAGSIESQSGTLRLPSGFTNAAGALRLFGGRIDASGVLTFAGGILDGAGFFGENNFTGGVISPGAGGGGRIIFTSGLKLGPGVTMVVDSAQDQLAVNGSVDLGGASFQLGALLAPPGADRITILDNDGSDAISGFFKDLPEGGFLNSGVLPASISYADGGNDVSLTLGVARAISFGRAPNGNFQFSGIGLGLRIYQVSATTNFASWDFVGTVTADALGEIEFTDPETSLHSKRFYRLRLAP